MPMGIYSGNNMLFSPTTSLPDDSDTLDASEFNVAFEQLSDKTAWLGFRTNGNPGQNWLDGILNWATAATVILKPSHIGPTFTWDPCYGQWLAVAQDSTGTYSTLSSNDGLNWFALGGAGSGSSGNYRSFGANTGNSHSVPPWAGVVVRPSDGLVSIFAFNFQALFNQTLQQYTYSAYSNSSILNSGLYYGIWFGAGVNLFLMLTSGAHLTLAGVTRPPEWSADGINYTAAATWAPASGFTANPYALVFASTGPTPAVYAFSGTVGYTTYQVTTDGKNWSAGAMPALLAGEAVVGAVWDQALQARNGGATGGLLILVSSSTQARLFNATVLLGSIPHQCWGLASNNGEIVTMAAFGTANTGFGANQQVSRLIQSVDFGNSWQLTSLQYNVAMTSFTGTSEDTFVLIGNGGQFLFSAGGSVFARTMTSGQLPQLPF
jgi:hypothetical protein